MPIRTSYEPGRPCYVDLANTDHLAAGTFYAELLGATHDVDPRPEAAGYGRLLHDGHVVAGIGSPPAPGMPDAYWLTYIATADADATAEAITANGGTVLQGPFDVFDLGRSALFRAPDGAVAAVWQAERHIGSAFVTEPGGWSWNHLLTRDKQAAVEFYRAVFDWRLRDDPEWGEHFALGEDGGEIASASDMGAEFPPDVSAQWGVTFMVADADASLAWAQERGATPLGPVEDMAMSGRTASLMDPQGASFGILSFPTPFAPPEE